MPVTLAHSSRANPNGNLSRIGMAFSRRKTMRLFDQVVRQNAQRGWQCQTILTTVLRVIR